jgi:HD superfamily phosphohydrolase YqeK
VTKEKLAKGKILKYCVPKIRAETIKKAVESHVTLDNLFSEADKINSVKDNLFENPQEKTTLEKINSKPQENIEENLFEEFDKETLEKFQSKQIDEEIPHEAKFDGKSLENEDVLSVYLK